jgi:hydroxypyruvate isomerase
MIKLAANVSCLFADVPFLDRYAKAAAAGFKGIECLFPYEHLTAEVAACLEANALEQVLFNAPAGDWAGGERGFAAVPGREGDFRASIDQALRYADATAVRRIHVMAGIASSRDQRARATYLANLEYAAQRFAEHDITLLIEPLNYRDVPGYFLANFDHALTLIRTLGADNVRLQFDIYHRQILCGDVTVGLREAFREIGHIQIASVPARNEPDRGELSLPYLFRTLEELGYDGWIGCEYRPAGRTEEGLEWAAGYLRHGR